MPQPFVLPSFVHRDAIAIGIVERAKTLPDRSRAIHRSDTELEQSNIEQSCERSLLDRIEEPEAASSAKIHGN